MYRETTVYTVSDGYSRSTNTAKSYQYCFDQNQQLLIVGAYVFFTRTETFGKSIHQALNQNAFQHHVFLLKL